MPYKATAVPPAAPQQARPATPLPPKPLEPTVKEVVLANRAGGRPVLAWVKQLHELAGKSFERFQLIKVLGDGSSGVVFLAVDSALNRQVALKLFRPEFGRDEKGRLRFVRGMTSAIRLHHENVVALYDAGLSTQHCWISMEYVAGESLADLLRRSDGKHPGWPQALLWAGHLGQALQFLHRNGVLHRNVLPNNILIRSGDLVAKLGDVMLAKAMEEDGEGVTASGELVGNIYYMAPERTDSSATVDGRSDLYSLGATLYTVVTGRRPSTGASMVEVITNIRRTPPEPPRVHNSSLPEPFEKLLLRLLQKRPQDRYQSAAEFLKDVEKVTLSTAGGK
jgi:serine/threonine-protein kinase